MLFTPPRRSLCRLHTEQLFTPFCRVIISLQPFLYYETEKTCASSSHLQKSFFFHSNISSLQLDSFYSATNVIIIIYFSMAVRHAGPVKTVVESIDRGKSAHIWYFEQEGLGGRRRGRADLCANCALNAALYSVASQ